MLKVITGCMFSGKTSELIRRVNLSRIAGYNCVLFKHALDKRYSEHEVAIHPTRDGDAFLPAASLLCTPLGGAADLALAIDKALEAGVDVIAVDEIQFFDPEAIDCISSAADRVTVIVAGLKADAQGIPFPLMPPLLADADEITMLNAVCTAQVAKNGKVRTCGEPATQTISLRPTEKTGLNLISVGSYGHYAARCRACWSKGSGDTLRTH